LPQGRALLVYDTHASENKLTLLGLYFFLPGADLEGSLGGLNPPS